MVKEFQRSPIKFNKLKKSVELFKSGENHFKKHIPKIFDIIDQISWDCRTLQSGEDHFEKRF